jgi:manganese/iron transport system substrate-binding protein
MKQTLCALTNICLALLLAACAPAQKSSGKKRVLTSFTILADIARQVAGDVVEVDSITKPGAEIHGYEPTPQDLVRAQGADLILWNGLNLEQWFERFVERLSQVPRVQLTEGIEPLSIDGGPYSGKPNPHAWMSSANAVIYVENIRKALSQLAPEHQAVFAENAQRYSAALLATDAPLREKLAAIPESKRWLVTSEGAFSYMCRSYGLKELYLWPINADAQGTPQQVQRVIDAVRSHSVPVVFSESTVSDKPMLQVAAESGARYGGVLYVDSLTDATGPAPSFLKLLECNAQTLARGFAL